MNIQEYLLTSLWKLKDIDEFSGRVVYIDTKTKFIGGSLAKILGKTNM